MHAHAVDQTKKGQQELNISLVQACGLLAELLGMTEQQVQKYIDIADIVYQNPLKQILCYHRHARLRYGYREYLTGKMTMESFLALGDISSTHTVYDVCIKQVSSLQWAQELYTLYTNAGSTKSARDTYIQKNTLYIVDSLALKYISSSTVMQEIGKYMEQEYGSLLCDC